MENNVETTRHSEDKNINISTLEWFLIIVFILGGVFIGYRFVMGPRFWDDLLYMHTAWSMEPKTFILNRYFSIYLLGFFNLIAKGDPFLGSRYYGAFIFSMIPVLIYINARILAKRHHWLIGLLAVVFLFTFSDFVNEFGVVLPDYTVTLLMLAGVLTFLLFHRSKFNINILLVLFGLILVLAFRSKETGITLCLLIPGFFLAKENNPTSKEFFRQSGLMLIGCLLGILLFMLLNGLILKDVLFGLRLSDIREVFEFNTNQRVNPQNINNNYLYYITPNLIFLLSFVWIIKSDDKDKLINRWLLLIVLGIILFLNLTNINGGFNFVHRYLTPAFAIVSIMAAQVLQIEHTPLSHQKNNHLLPIVGGALLLSGIITSLISHSVAKSAGWRFEYFVEGVLSPVVFCILVYWMIFWRKYSVFSLLIIATCIGTLTLPIAIKNVYSKVRSDQTIKDKRFLPFAEFKNEITCDSENRILISGTIFQEHAFLGRDISSSQYMYDLFFGCHTPIEQFYYEKSQETIYQYLFANIYNYVFLDDTDYDFISNQSNQVFEILNRYSIIPSKDREYYLLKINP